MDILDTAGDLAYRKMIDRWIKERKGFIVVYSITSQNLFDEARSFMEKILKVKKEEKKLDEIAIVLVGNKCDLEENRKVTEEEGKELAEECGREGVLTSFMET